MNKTVLIIDDDEVLRRALGRGLRAEGFNVLTADSAESARETLTRMRVDAIVLDRMMGGMDGLTFLKDMRARGIGTPVIMLTAMTGPENAIDGLAGGANDYLAKPFQLRELILRLNNMMKHIDHTYGQMPQGLMLIDDEFFIQTDDNAPRVLALSGAEKNLLSRLIAPMGNIAQAAPMVAKRLRSKLNCVLSNIDIITIRGCGYKLVNVSARPQTNGETQ